MYIQVVANTASSMSINRPCSKSGHDRRIKALRSSAVRRRVPPTTFYKAMKQVEEEVRFDVPSINFAQKWAITLAKHSKSADDSLHNEACQHT